MCESVSLVLGQRLPSCRQDILDIKEKLRGVMSGKKNPELGNDVILCQAGMQVYMYLYKVTMCIMLWIHAALCCSFCSVLVT